ncbi:MAG TPA: hypothetical protein VEY90_07080 [Thermoleophilaceae bacterium]|jgi:hypothetical protein|nr:hypothetical protein [Thermoleophilaceae bacterium]
MKTATKALALAGAALALSAGPGVAATPPPQECAAGGNLEFGYGACVSTIATGKLSTAAYIANCKGLEAGFAESNESGRPYPYTFYGDVPSTELPPGWPIITAKNRFGCVSALRVYHGMQ